MNSLCTKQPLNKGHPYITAKILFPKYGRYRGVPLYSHMHSFKTSIDLTSVLSVYMNINGLHVQYTVCAILLYLIIRRLTWLGVSTSSDLSVPVDAESLLLEMILLSETFLSSSFNPDEGRGELSGHILRGLEINFRTILDFLTLAGGELGVVSVGVFEIISLLG